LNRRQDDFNVEEQFMTKDPILMEAVVNSPGLLAAVIGPDGRVIQVNLTLCELLSTTPEKLTGSTAAGTVIGGDKLAQVLEVIPQGPWQPSVLQIETTLKSPRTGDHLIAYTVSPRITQNYGAVAILVGYDVTDRARVTEALRNSEAKVRAILDTAVDAIITINEHGVIESFNPAAERIFGYNSTEVIGHKVETLMPEPYHSEHQGYLDNYKKTGHAKIIGIGREVTGRRKDGTTFPMYLAVGQQLIAGRRHFTGIVRDLTNVKELEMQMLQMSDNIHRKIGQDLHDGLGQLLTGTALQSKALSEQLKKNTLSWPTRPSSLRH
jgi:PAS domain S-box-containing protein